MKYCGIIGYLEAKETKPGLWTENVIERKYYGDVIRNNRRQENPPDTPNDSITVSNSISIVADAFAYNHFFSIGYAEWCGALWRVTNVEVLRPRLILTLGGVYNGPTANTTDTGESAGES